MINNRLVTLVIGPMGVGKSQFCNFVQNDRTNSINKVMASLKSCTQKLQSNKFTRIQTNFDFIDTPGNNEEDAIEMVNLQNLVNHLKNLKQIHFIILALKFGERFTANTKDYIEALGKIFTVREFFCHLCIVFTHFPNNPEEEHLKTKDTFNLEINQLLKDIFQPDEIDNLPDNKTYFINTSNSRNEQNYQKNQKIVDEILKQIVSNQQLHNPINTENLDITGKNVKLRRLKELESLKKQLEEEKRLKEKAEREAETARISYEQEKNQNEKMLSLKRKFENEARERKERFKNEQLYNLEHQKNTGVNLADKGAKLGIGSIGLGLLGFCITPICPIAGPVLMGVAAGGGVTGATGVGLGVNMAKAAESEKINFMKKMENEN